MKEQGNKPDLRDRRGASEARPLFSRGSHTRPASELKGIGVNAQSEASASKPLGEHPQKEGMMTASEMPHWKGFPGTTREEKMAARDVFIAGQVAQAKAAGHHIAI